MGVSQKGGGPIDPKGYRGIIRGFYRAPLRDYIMVILRNTHIGILLGLYIGIMEKKMETTIGFRVAV